MKPIWPQNKVTVGYGYLLLRDTSLVSIYILLKNICCFATSTGGDLYILFPQTDIINKF